MKGGVDSMMQAVMLAVICIVIIFISLGLVLLLGVRSVFGGSSQILQEFELVGASIKPYSVAETLAAYRPNDRSFLENAIEASATGSLQRSASQIQAPLKNFLDFFGLDYQVKIVKSNTPLMTINSFVTPCAEGRGICTYTTTSSCGEGRTQLPDPSCALVCCSTEISGGERCGESLNGVCTSPLNANLPDPQIALLPCGEGRQQITGACSGGKICCIYDNTAQGDIYGRAEIPLVYKGQLVGIATVETG